jgi:hypothetical protein
MRASVLGLGAMLCASIASGGCKTEVDDPVGQAGSGVQQTGGAGGAITAGTSGAAAGGTGGMTAPGIAGMTAGGTGGMTAAGTGGMTAGGTGGMIAAGTGGMTAGGTGGMTAGGTGGGGGGGGDATAMCIADAAAMGRTGACTECGCMKCLDKINDCQDDLCANVVACGQMNGCKGRDCYCGVGVDALMCAINGATGPCMMEIATAAGVCTAGMESLCASDLSAVTNPTSAMYDATNPVSRANLVSVCTRGQVADPGVPGIVAAVPAIAGMCETECM